MLSIKFGAHFETRQTLSSFLTYDLCDPEQKMPLGLRLSTQSLELFLEDASIPLWPNHLAVTAGTCPWLPPPHWASAGQTSVKGWEFSCSKRAPGNAISQWLLERSSHLS